MLPFIATFLVVVFVLMMQAVWLAFDNFAGKGIDVVFILKFLFYLSLTLIPMALPIGVLLSSIIAFGSLSENYEFAAIKSAGVNLMRSMRSIIIFSTILSMCCFFFMNNIYPWAVLKQKNLYYNIKKKKPALALIPGVFNSDIPGYTIRFQERYGKDQNLLKNIHIAELKGGFGKVKVITAAKGEINTDPSGKYLKLKLLNGNFYQEHLKKRMGEEEKKRMPASVATFESYDLNLDISSFSEEDLSKTKFTKHYGMLSLKQLDSISKKNKVDFDKNIQSNVKNILRYLGINESQKNSISNNLNDATVAFVLDSVSNVKKVEVVQKAINKIQSIQNRAAKDMNITQIKRKVLNLYDYEFNYRITFSMACLVLFFIGAPLGAIIRKGGFGLPLIFSITIFISYFMFNQFGKNLAEESVFTSTIGGWLSTFIMLPIAILLTQKATKGVDVDFISKFKKIVQKILKKRNHT